jgi:hypothetical protein
MAPYGPGVRNGEPTRTDAIESGNDIEVRRNVIGIFEAQYSLDNELRRGCFDHFCQRGIEIKRRKLVFGH